MARFSYRNVNHHICIYRVFAPRYLMKYFNKAIPYAAANHLKYDTPGGSIKDINTELNENNQRYNYLESQVDGVSSRNNFHVVKSRFECESIKSLNACS